MTRTSRPSSTRLRDRVWVVPLLLVLGLGALTGCQGAAGGGGAGDESASGSSGGSVASSADQDADQDTGQDTEPLDESAADSGGGDDAVRSGEAARVEPMQRAVISTGQVSLRSTDVARDRAEVLRLVTGWRGLVADEQSGTGDGDGEVEFSSLTLRVPSTRFDEAMASLAEVGTLVEQSRTSEDVTTQVVDVEARVRAQQRSVRRIETLLGEAESLRDVIAIESELAQRQGELESLTAQQEALADQTSLSTITVTLDGARDRAPRDDDDGFLGGLRSGWSALGASVAVVLTATGAVLPFAAVAALVGVPTALVVRRRRARPAAPVGEAA